MASYILRRLLLLFPTLLGITLVVFFVMSLSPGSVITMMRSAEGDMRPEDRQRTQAYLQHRYGLDQPKIVQYARWLNRISPVGFKYPGTTLDLPALRSAYADALAKGQSPQAALADVQVFHADPAEQLALDDGQLVARTVRTGEGFPAAWRFGLKIPDLGQSIIRRRPVLDVILEAMPITLLLNGLTIPIIYIVSLVSGIYAARRRGKAFDVISGGAYIALYSMPTIWIGVLLLGFLASKDYLNAFPTGGLHSNAADAMTFLPVFAAGFHPGWLLDALWHLVLPVLCLTYGGFAFLSKLMRASVLENLNADFARTARAKGLSEHAVLFRHVLANSILPLITVAAGILPSLLGGSVVVESIFSINGMGRLMLEAIKMKDQELVLSNTCVIALISLVSLIVADIAYAIADPRVSYE